MSVIIFITVTNVVVDPYGVFRFVESEGFNKEKPAMAENSLAVNIIGINKVKPNTLVLGTSRASIGIDPTHELIQNPYGRSFNFAVGAASIEEIYLTTKYIHQFSPLKKVIVGLDMLSFNAYRGVRGNFSKDSLFVENIYFNKQTFDAVFSLNSFKASLATVRKQGRPKNMTVTPTGHMYYADGYVAAKKGNREMFISTERDYLTKNWYPAPQGKFAFVNEKRDTFKVFADFLAFARAEGIELYFYTSPIHVRLMKLMQIDGLYDGFEDWKRRLVAIAEDSNAEYSSAHNDSQFKIIDFAYYNSITSETVPPLGDRENIMQYYYEDSHFPAVLGDIVIERLFGGELLSDLLENKTTSGGAREGSNSDSADAVTAFGVHLTSSNIEAHLKASREALEAYSATHPLDIKELTTTHTKYRRAAEGN